MKWDIRVSDAEGECCLQTSAALVAHGNTAVVTDCSGTTGANQLSKGIKPFLLATLCEDTRIQLQKVE